jgi:ribosomal protein S6--L-glutamate ligase
VGHPAARTAPGRLCFVVEERYDKHVLLGAVVDVLRFRGHRVGVLRPNGEVADRWSPLEATA